MNKQHLTIALKLNCIDRLLMIINCFISKLNNPTYPATMRVRAVAAATVDG